MVCTRIKSSEWFLGHPWLSASRIARIENAVKLKIRKQWLENQKSAGLDDTFCQADKNKLHADNRINEVEIGATKALNGLCQSSSMKFFNQKVAFFGGLECVGHFLAYVASPILYFCEMSGFEPRELPYQAGALGQPSPTA
jgi:hypothetical protein